MECFLISLEFVSHIRLIKIPLKTFDKGEVKPGRWLDGCACHIQSGAVTPDNRGCLFMVIVFLLLFNLIYGMYQRKVLLNFIVQLYYDIKQLYFMLFYGAISKHENMWHHYRVSHNVHCILVDTASRSKVKTLLPLTKACSDILSCQQHTSWVSLWSSSGLSTGSSRLPVFIAS